jgi:Trk K+ transport system NAD-binding subunit
MAARGQRSSRQDSSDVVLQRYSAQQRFRAYMYGRLPLLAESVVSLGLLVLVVLLDMLALLFTHTGAGYTPVDALIDTLKLLTFQGGTDTQQVIGPIIYAFNILFALLVIQSLISSTRAFFNKLDPLVRQRGLATTCNDHVIVCGLGRLGVRVVTRLVESGNRAVVIERDWESEFVPRILEMGVPVINGDAREERTLRRAGLKRACALIAGIDNDLLDVEIALAARALRPDLRVVLRAFNETFDQALERHFGANTAYSVSALAAPTFAGAAISRGAAHVLPLDNVLLGVGELDLPAQIKGAAQEFERANGVRIVQHADSAGHVQPVAGTRPLRAGDRLTFVGTLAGVEALRALAGGPPEVGATGVPLLDHPTTQYDTVIVCGHGKVGYRVVRWLARQQPRPRIVVIHNGDETTMLADELVQLVAQGVVEAFIGDARTPELLRQAHLERAVAVAAVTSDDLVNLQIGMEARRQRPDVHVVLRAFSDALADNLVTLFGIHTAFSTSALASATLAAAAEVGGVTHAFSADGRLIVMDEIAVGQGSRLAGRSVEALRKQYGAVVAGLRRGGALAMLPPDDATLDAGDVAFLIAPLPALTKLRHG